MGRNPQEYLQIVDALIKKDKEILDDNRNIATKTTNVEVNNMGKDDEQTSLLVKNINTEEVPQTKDQNNNDEFIFNHI